MFPDLEREQREKVFFNGFYTGIEKFQDVDRVLMEISKDFNIVFVTKGTRKSLLEKEKWLKENLYSGIKYKFIGLPMSADKTEVDMRNGIIIDDQVEYLEKSNAGMKILYADRMKPTEWNNYLTMIDGYIVGNWNDVLQILNFVREEGLYTND